jgi:uncharacterized membrane protein YphA (DoxX/SURF4 family)
MSRTKNIALWVAQVLLFVTFVGGALWKVMTPVDQLAAKMPWMANTQLLYVTAFFDALGGIGVLLPTLTRIKPRLAALAAVGLIALQLSAVVFHFSRGEGANTPFNFFLIALAAFVAWGRR